MPVSYCPNCGTEVSADSRYCPECGEEMGITAEGTTSSNDQTQKDDSTSNNVKGAITLVVLVVIIGWALTAGGGGGTAEDPSTSDPSANGGGENAGTGESSSEGVSHEMGETFTVGSGDRSVEYTVQEATTVDSIGTSMVSEEADGTFVVVRMTIENTGTEPFTVTNDHLKLFDEEERTFSATTTIYMSQDDRFEADSLSFEELQPGLSITRNVVYDVPPGQSYGLQVEGTSMFSTAEPHYVPLGQAG